MTLYYVDWNREFGRPGYRRRCTLCGKRPSVGNRRFGTHLCHACEDTELELTRTIYRDEFARKNQ
jgi:hypothetical protein